MEKILQLQKDYFKLGYTETVTFKEMMLIKLKKAIKENERELKEALYKDLNKDFKEAYFTEFFMIYKSINHMLKNLNKYSKNQKVKTPLILKPGKSYTRSIPYGQALIMSAYNYPLLLSIDPLIGSIAGGNTSILALSKNSKHTNEVLIRIINSTFESKYIYALETDRNINETLLGLDFDKIFFTGSKKVGQIVLEAASKKMISTSLELGGKSPALVLKDANIKTSASNIIYSKVLNAGQTCIASDYVLVEELVAKQLIDEMQKVYKKFYPDFNKLGKLVNKESYNRIENMLKKDEDYLINEVEYDPENNKIGLAFLQVDINEAHNLVSMETEIFGPILPIITYRNLDDALRYINSKDNSLALYVFSKDRGNIEYVLHNVTSGGISINSTILHMVNENLPFSGFKDSGLGSYHGKYSYEAFTYKQAVYKKSFLNLHKLIFPPYK